MRLNSFLIKNKLPLLPVLFAFFMIGLFANAPKVVAAAECSYDGTWLQANVFVKIVDSNNNLVGYSNDFRFNVTATVPPTMANGTRNVAIDYLDQAIIPGPSPSQDFTASAHTHNCDSPSDGKQPAYDFTDKSNGNALLNCLGGAFWGYPAGSGKNPVTTNPKGPNKINTASFTFSAISPGSTAGSGSWDGSTSQTFSPTSTQDLNYAGQKVVIFTWKQKNWKLTGSTSADKTSAYPGQTMKFTSSITNDNQGGTANFAYGPRYFYSNNSSGSPAATTENDGGIPNAGGVLASGASLTGILQTVSVPANTAYNYVCGTVAFSPYDSNGHPDGRSTAKCVTIRHPSLSCGAYTPTSVGPGQPFPATASLTTTAADLSAIATYGSPSFFYRIYNSAGAKVYDAGAAPATSSGGTYTINVSPGGLVPAGHYTIAYGVSSTLVNKSCPGAIDAAYHPYFTTTGGDIMSNGNIQSWNVDNIGGAGYAGAGGQLAALATGNITSFVTGTGLGSNPSGLAFANTFTGGTRYGGGYAVGAATLPTVSTSGATALVLLSASLNGLRSGVYTRNGDLTLYGTLPTSQNATIVMTSGNLYITSDLTYASYSNLSEIPRLTVIVQNGNIYVNNYVTEVHGVFYAGGTGKGIFYSCATSISAQSTDYVTCKYPLTVYGAVTANKLVLSRSYGSLHASAGVTAVPAENFFYSPEVWLAPSSTTSGSSSTIYNSYVSLPPIL
jgi:hypothetical protein